VESPRASLRVALVDHRCNSAQVILLGSRECSVKAHLCVSRHIPEGINDVGTLRVSLVKARQAPR
jgi:hypothetical protein